MKPKKLGRLILKEELFAITGCLEEAIILNQMCYWSERMNETDKFLEEEYTMLVEHVPVLSHGWIYKSASELAGEMFGAVSEKTMNRILDRLVKKNFLRRRFNPNPKYKFDKTYHYRVNFVEIMCHLKNKKMPLSGYHIIEEFVNRLEQGVAPKRHFDGSENHSDGAIPETITKTTDKEKPLTPLQGEEESSAMASHSSEVVTQPNLFSTNPSEANASGSAIAKLNSADGNGTTPPIPLAPPRTIPTELDTPEFNAAWNEFLQHRKEKKSPMTPTAKNNMFRKFTTWGVENAVVAIDAAISNGWTGVFEPKQNKSNSKPERLCSI